MTLRTKDYSNVLLRKPRKTSAAIPSLWGYFSGGKADHV
jgi:hypothetical protein